MTIQEKLEEIVSLLIAIEENTRPVKPVNVVIEKSKRDLDKDNLFG